MPRHKQKSKQTKRSSSLFKINLQSVSKAPNPFGEQRRCKMLYSFAGYDGTVNPGFWTSTLQLGNLRSLDGAGSNPLGYDQMSAIFKRFKVMGATIDWEVGVRNYTQPPERFAAFPCYPDFVPTTTRQAVERPQAISGVTSAYWLSKFHQVVDCASLVGRNFADIDFSGTAATDPAKVIVVRLAGNPIVAATTYIFWTAKVVLDVLWTEPIIPADA